MTLIKSLAFLAVFCRVPPSPSVAVLLVKEQVAQDVPTYQPDPVVVPLSTTSSQPSLPVKPVTQNVSTYRLGTFVVPVTRSPSKPSFLAEPLANNGSIFLSAAVQQQQLADAARRCPSPLLAIPVVVRFRVPFDSLAAEVVPVSFSPFLSSLVSTSLSTALQQQQQQLPHVASPVSPSPSLPSLLAEPVAKNVPTSLSTGSQRSLAQLFTDDVAVNSNIQRSFLPEPLVNNVSVSPSIALLHCPLSERGVALLPPSPSIPVLLVEPGTQNTSTPVSTTLQQLLEQVIADDVSVYPAEQHLSLPEPLTAVISVLFEALPLLVHVTIIMLGAKLGEMWVLDNLTAKPMNQRKGFPPNQAVLPYLLPAASVLPCLLVGRILLAVASLIQIAMRSGLFFAGKLLGIPFVVREKSDSSKEGSTTTTTTIKLLPTLALLLLGIISTLEAAVLPAVALSLFMAGAHDWLASEERVRRDEEPKNLSSARRKQVERALERESRQRYPAQLHLLVRFNNDLSSVEREASEPTRHNSSMRHRLEPTQPNSNKSKRSQSSVPSPHQQSPASSSSPSPASTSPYPLPSTRPAPSHSPPSPLPSQTMSVEKLSAITMMLLWTLIMIGMVPSSYLFFFGCARTALGCSILLNRTPPSTTTTEESSRYSVSEIQSKKLSGREQIWRRKLARTAFKRKVQLELRLRREQNNTWAKSSRKCPTMVLHRKAAKDELFLSRASFRGLRLFVGLLQCRNYTSRAAIIRLCRFVRQVIGARRLEARFLAVNPPWCGQERNNSQARNVDCQPFTSLRPAEHDDSCGIHEGQVVLRNLDEVERRSGCDLEPANGVERNVPAPPATMMIMEAGSVWREALDVRRPRAITEERSPSSRPITVYLLKRGGRAVATHVHLHWTHAFFKRMIHRMLGLNVGDRRLSLQNFVGNETRMNHDGITLFQYGVTDKATIYLDVVDMSESRKVDVKLHEPRSISVFVKKGTPHYVEVTVQLHWTLAYFKRFVKEHLRLEAGQQGLSLSGRARPMMDDTITLLTYGVTNNATIDMDPPEPFRLNGGAGRDMITLDAAEAELKCLVKQFRSIANTKLEKTLLGHTPLAKETRRILCGFPPGVEASVRDLCVRRLLSELQNIRGLTQVLAAFVGVGSFIYDLRTINKMSKEEQLKVLRQVIESAAKAMPDHEERDVLIGENGILRDLSLKAMLPMVGEVQSIGKVNKRPLDLATGSSPELLSLVVQAYKAAIDDYKGSSQVKLTAGVAQKGLKAWRDTLPPHHKKSSAGTAVKVQKARREREKNSRKTSESAAGDQQQVKTPRPSRPASGKSSRRADEDPRAQGHKRHYSEPRNLEHSDDGGRKRNRLNARTRVTSPGSASEPVSSEFRRRTLRRESAEKQAGDERSTMERDELECQVNALQLELDKLRRAQATSQQSDELTAQVAKLQCSLAESERRASDLESEVAEQEQRAHDLEREVAEREKREHDLASEVAEREQREHDLQREVAGLKRQVWNLESTATGLAKKTMQVFQQVVRAIFRQSTFFPDHLRRMVSSDISFLREHFQINDLQLTACELVITWPAVPFPLIKDFKRLVCFLKTRLSDLPKETRALVADPLERLRDVASRVVGPVEQVYDNASERTRQPSQTMGEGEMHTVQGREKFARGAPIDDEMALPSYIDDNGQSRIPDDEWWGLVYPNGNGSHVAASSLTSAGARTRRDAVPKPSCLKKDRKKVHWAKGEPNAAAVFKNYDHKAIVPPDSTDDAEHSSNLICEHLSSEKFEELFSLERSEDRYLERNRTSKEEIEMTKANSAILAELDFLSDEEEEEEEDNPEQRRKLERKKRRQSGIFTRDFSLEGEVEKEKPGSQD